MVKKLKLRENVNNLESFLDTVIDDVTVHCNGKELETYVEDLLLDIVERRFNDSIFVKTQYLGHMLAIVLSTEDGDMDFQLSLVYDMSNYRLSIKIESMSTDPRRYNEIIPLVNLSDISTALYNMLDYFVSSI